MTVNETISTQRLEICNADGQRAITLDCWRDGKPFIRMYDSEGLERLVFCLDVDDYPQIGILNKKGQTLIGIGTTENLGSGVNIFDSEGELKLVALVNPDGKVVLESNPSNSPFLGVKPGKYESGN